MICVYVKFINALVKPECWAPIKHVIFKGTAVQKGSQVLAPR